MSLSAMMSTWVAGGADCPWVESVISTPTPILPGVGSFLVDFCAFVGVRVASICWVTEPWLSVPAVATPATETAAARLSAAKTASLRFMRI